MPSPEQIAWAAGLFEGEGSVSARRSAAKAHHRRNMAMQMAVYMTDKEPLERLAEVLGGKVSGPYHSASMPAHYKSRWVWRMTRAEDIRAAYENMKPWLCQRRRDRFEELLREWDAQPPPMSMKERSLLGNAMRRAG